MVDRKPPSPPAVERSDLVTTREQAREYYRANLARAHHLVVRGCPVSIVFERDATHLYSDDPHERQGVYHPTDIPIEQRVVRRLPSRRYELRRFNLHRARHMDEVLRAITLYTFAESAGVFCGREKVLLYGAPLPSGACMRVVLRPGPGDAFTCVSAYMVSHYKWVQARDRTRARPARFPPEIATKK